MSIAAIVLAIAAMLVGAGTAAACEPLPDMTADAWRALDVRPLRLWDAIVTGDKHCEPENS